MTIVEMLCESARKHPDKTALVFKDSRLTYTELLNKVKSLACFLVDSGLRKGERVGVMLEKTPEAVISFLGAAAAGGVVFPVDYSLTPTDLQYVTDLTRPSALIVAAKFQAAIFGARLPCPDERIIVVGERARPATRLWARIMSRTDEFLPPVRLGDDDMVYLNFTSGTTGTPKAAVTTHNNIYWNTRASVETLRLKEGDVHICMFPVFAHPHELFARPVFLGGTIVLVEGISPKAIARAILDNGVTCMMAVASIYASMVKLDPLAFPNLGLIRIAESGGMHVPPSVAAAFVERFGVSIVPVWGSTETTGIALAKPLDSEYRPNALGPACAHYEAKLIADDGSQAESDEVGELVVKGPGVCSAYYKNPEETASHMKDGWMRTGDMFKMDSCGHFFFQGRRGGMLKVAGIKVSPIEIEEAIRGHPAVGEVAVVRAQDPTHGEVPKAFVVPREGLELTKMDVVKYCEKRLARYKIPRIVEIIKELPRTPGGKVSYKTLESLGGKHAD